MRKDSLLRNDSFRIILEFVILLLVIVMIIVLVLTSQTNGNSDDKDDAQTIYDNLTEVIGEKSSKTIDKLLSVTFDETNNKLCASAYSGNTLVDFSMTVPVTSLDAYLPSLLVDGFEEELAYDCSTFAINGEALLANISDFEQSLYRVATYGADTLLNGTFLSDEGIYSSVYQRTYHLASNTWDEDGHLTNIDSEEKGVLVELYKLILAN
ncbi:MAG TPA: hypothetical protein PKO28_03830 [Bacilli bacterium]|nr:hypothetical protein [Bacilli bacterium]HPS18955.1 hypothetical protein [Bacilli bacterium]